MKKIVCTIVVISVIIQLISVSRTYATPQIMLTVTSAQGNRSDVVGIKVNLTAGSGMQACNFRLYYDSSVLEVLSASAGMNLKASPIINTNGLGKIVYSYAATSALSTSGTLLDVQFKIKEQAPYGYSPVILECKEFADGSYSEIEHSVRSGQVDVIAPELEAPYSLSIISSTSNSIGIYWDDIEGATGYNIYIDNELYNDLPIEENECSISGLLPNTEYRIQLTTLHFSTESCKSEMFIVETTEAEKTVCFFYLKENGLGVLDYAYSYVSLDGKTAIPPEIPIIPGYVFSEWDNDLSNLDGGELIWAIYSPVIYTVNFYDWDGVLLSTQEVEHGRPALEPNIPERAGYNFLSWSETFEEVKSDLQIHAQYEEISHFHSPASIVIENRIEETCIDSGSYDQVVYCTECGEVITRETIIIPALGHAYTAVITAPTATDQGYTTHTCSRCGDSYVDNYTDPIAPVDENAPQLVISNSRAMSGDEFTVAVNLKNNPGIAGMVLSPVYDSSIINLKSVKKGDLDFAVSSVRNITFDTDGENVECDGILFSMTFDVNEDAPEGEYPVSLIVRECTNENWDDVDLAVVGGMLTVYDFIWGDADGDNQISIKDVVLARKYLASYDYDTETSTVAVGPGTDANGDSVVSIKDVVLIRSYLANYDYDTGTSSVILGPQ